MEKVTFLFCVHNHQAVEKFPHVIENAYEKAYVPFIDVLKKYPFMEISIRSSSLFEFVAAALPAYRPRSRPWAGQAGGAASFGLRRRREPRDGLPYTQPLNTR